MCDSKIAFLPEADKEIQRAAGKGCHVQVLDTETSAEDRN
jgi:hypothetical protein